MKVKLLTSVVFDSFLSVSKGQEVEVGSKQGKSLVKAGLAVEIKKPKTQEVKKEDEKTKD